MPRTATKQKPIQDYFFDELTSVIRNPIGVKSDDKIWEEIPVSVEEFCLNHIGEGLYPIQAGFAEEVLGSDPLIWDSSYEGGNAFWGKGSGKDRTIAKMNLYVVYKLLCMKNPQKTLREIYGCNIGDGDAIDIGNMSFNARQAQNVYFKKFKTLLLTTYNPKTGNNWFEEKGVDLREGYDIQNTEVRFPKNITAHSLNSETNTGEGLNLFFSTIDEFGTFPVDKAFKMLDAVRDTVTSRFKSVGKVCVISYKYYNNDPMDILYNREENDLKIYCSKAATWEVNIMSRKEDFSRKYQRNPEKARMTFECEGEDKEMGYVTKKYMLGFMFDGSIENPLVGDLITVDSIMLSGLQFKDFFRGKPATIYTARVDLAKGKLNDKGDAVGLSICHSEMMKPKVDSKLIQDLAKEGIVIESYDHSTVKGVMVDLALQIVANKGGEVGFSDVRNFILMIKKKYGFNIQYVTYDGYQSTESIQEFQNNGIEAWVLSVDRTNESYDLWKEKMYQQVFKCYAHDIAKREAEELILDNRGLVDHPEKSWKRELTEGTEKGSKDVMDAIVGAGHVAIEKINLNPSVFFG